VNEECRTITFTLDNQRKIALLSCFQEIWVICVGPFYF